MDEYFHDANRINILWTAISDSGYVLYCKIIHNGSRSKMTNKYSKVLIFRSVDNNKFINSMSDDDTYVVGALISRFVHLSKQSLRPLMYYLQLLSNSRIVMSHTMRAWLLDCIWNDRLVACISGIPFMEQMKSHQLLAVLLKSLIYQWLTCECWGIGVSTSNYRCKVWYRIVIMCSVAMVDDQCFWKFGIAWDIKFDKLPKYLGRWSIPKTGGVTFWTERIRPIIITRGHPGRRTSCFDTTFEYYLKIVVIYL
jgi:hypothetical protein